MSINQFRIQANSSGTGAASRQKLRHTAKEVRRCKNISLALVCLFQKCVCVFIQKPEEKV